MFAAIRLLYIVFISQLQPHSLDLVGRLGILQIDRVAKPGRFRPLVGPLYVAAGVQGKYVSPRVTNLALQYLGHAIKTAATWKLLKPHTPGLVATVLLPLMCYDDEDAELWSDDPHEYIRKVPRGQTLTLTMLLTLPYP